MPCPDGTVTAAWKPAKVSKRGNSTLREAGHTYDLVSIVIQFCSQKARITNRCGTDGPTYESSVVISADSPCANSISAALFSVHAVRSVTASITSRAEG
ncbi:MAG: hypothetical protein J07HN6_01530 [Halonotius sp. J07HN6]|nr:MAG: hypothetical protein J07HN6_01530 [Halonotius sp. J07HN6]ERH05408.1 MAG: hypothetical protein J07HN4v3_01006 [Halonotius sp. J07HN4]